MFGAFLCSHLRIAWLMQLLALAVEAPIRKSHWLLRRFPCSAKKLIRRQITNKNDKTVGNA